MQEKIIVLDSKLLNRIYQFLKHPLVTLAIGILIPMAIGIMVVNKQEPSYFFSKPQLIAKSDDLKNQLKIFWEDEYVPNVHFVDFTFWNNGRQYIDPTDFIDSNPLNIYNSGLVKILMVTQVNISRPEIQFLPVIEDSIRNSVNIYLINDETLEHNDGITYHIVYSEISEGEWNLNGRIKGQPNGLEYINLEFIKTGNSKRTIIILWSIFFILMLTRIIVLRIAKKAIVFRPMELIFFLVLLGCTSYMTIEYYFHSVHLLWYN